MRSSQGRMWPGSWAFPRPTCG